jgi:hypothetical protein
MCVGHGCLSYLEGSKTLSEDRFRACVDVGAMMSLASSCASWDISAGRSMRRGFRCGCHTT